MINTQDKWQLQQAVTLSDNSSSPGYSSPELWKLQQAVTLSDNSSDPGYSSPELWQLVADSRYQAVVPGGNSSNLA